MDCPVFLAISEEGSTTLNIHLFHVHPPHLDAFPDLLSLPSSRSAIDAILPTVWIMPSYNPNISNGTCYYAENTETKGKFIPCGNDAIQVWPCCQVGSYCLSLGDANACYDVKSGNTYISGCTDPSFISPNCQHKPPLFHEQEWVAINQACTNLNAKSGTDGITNWTGCLVDNNSTELVKLPLASCTPYCSSTNILYAGSSSLAAYASLPTVPGSSIFWQSGYTPPATPAPGYTPKETTGVVPTSPLDSASDTNSGLSTGAKAGIGVGAGIGGILLLALLAGLFVMYFRRRRRHRQQPSIPHSTAEYGSPGFNHHSQDMTMCSPSSFIQPSPPVVYHHEMGTAPDYEPPTQTQVGANMGFRSELPADEQSPSYNSHISAQSYPSQRKPPLSPVNTPELTG
ncbi:hypothetical protein QBC38DRAFT_478410 [Podospora fimiseda]|uniref:Uncharacterized protein n=1 Tax=Podospora fimiseda TaxID=252190 RepID=A0AAN7BPJ1_9PEZI|nr:hypothetical protein QBC38DRAFT_478410 [Podospora fimiseda]